MPGRFTRAASSKRKRATQPRPKRIAKQRWRSLRQLPGGPGRWVWNPERSLAPSDRVDHLFNRFEHRHRQLLTPLRRPAEFRIRVRIMVLERHLQGHRDRAEAFG